MFSKSERLSRAAFTQCFAVGKRRHGLYSTVIFSPAATFACAVVVGKKVAKLAHERNLIRRQVYGILKESYHERSRLVGAFIILVKPSVTGLTKRQRAELLREEIGRALNNR